MLKGTMDVLEARGKFKSEMRLDVTTIKPTENNPIKFSVSVDEALFRLIIPQRDGYMSSDHSIKEAFDDIKAHQIAVLAGMQTALHSVLQRFDPKILEHRLQSNNSITAGIPFHKQTKLWDLFEQLYEEIEQETHDDFNRIFGQAFANAYSTQIKKLKANKN
jgi:type VI secretion system protein